MVMAPWRSPLARALHRNRSLAYSRYFQLATLNSTGRPSNRTVVFRGFFNETDQLMVVTDRRSQKVEDLARSVWAEACWYFPNSREQFRLTGPLTVIQDQSNDAIGQKARHLLWQNLSDAARLQFVWPYPGQPRTEQAAFDVNPPNPQTPVETFCLLLLNPEQVDHLELRGNPQTRTLYSLKSGEWSTQAVNP